MLSFTWPWSTDMDLILPGGLLALGLITGLKHSIEADHVAAISTIVSSDSNNKRFLHIPYVGFLWGAGHSISLFSVASIIMIFSIQIPLEMSNLFEFFVGVMLIYLGVIAITGLNLYRFFKGIRVKNLPHYHPHGHAQTNTTHSHIHTHDTGGHLHGHKSIIVGMVHGLAGSGALMILVLSMVNSIESGMMYIATFAIGSIISMAAASTIIGLPLMKIGKKWVRLNMTIRVSSSLISIIVGASIMIEMITTGKII